jgi:hypothetical protein
MPATENQALMFVATDVDPEHEAEWNRWYDARHIPQRKLLPGFLTAQRYRLQQGSDTTQRYLALYDLAGPEALESDAYLSLAHPPVQDDEDRAMLSYFRNRLRGTMRLISDTTAPGNASREAAGALLVVGVQPESGYEEEFNAWYDEEHIPFLTAVPGVLGVRRFQAIRDDLPYVAIWELANADVRGSEDWRRAANTPWTRRMFLQHCRKLIMGTYRPLGPEAGGVSATQSAEVKR